MNKNLLIAVGVGVVAMTLLVVFVFSSTKGKHLELNGQILKVRTGELDEKNSAAVLDMRVANPSDIPFVVRDVVVKVEKQDGSIVDAAIAPRASVKQLLLYNRFLGAQYNDVLTVGDKIPAKGSIDRMIAISVEVPAAVLQASKSVRVHLEDLDGASFDISHPVQ